MYFYLTHIHTHMYTHIHTHMYTHTHMHTHTHSLVQAEYWQDPFNLAEYRQKCVFLPDINQENVSHVTTTRAVLSIVFQTSHYERMSRPSHPHTLTQSLSLSYIQSHCYVLPPSHPHTLTLSHSTLTLPNPHTLPDGKRRLQDPALCPLEPGAGEVHRGHHGAAQGERGTLHHQPHTIAVLNSYHYIIP